MTEIKKLNDLQTLSDLLVLNNVVICGAGKVAHVLVEYLVRKQLSDKVYCIMVTAKENNPDEILGVPVCTIEDFEMSLNQFHIIIATMEKGHENIFRSIMEKCTSQLTVSAVSNILYASMRRENPSFEHELLQGMKSNGSKSDKIFWQLRQMNYQLKQMNRCRLYAMNSYEETLQPHEYENALKEWYQVKTGQRLDLKNPISYNEKIQWIKLNGITPKMKKLTDKYGVRKWIEDTIGGQYLTKQYGVWDSFEQINFRDLPDKYVLKCTHGCGFNLIVKNNRELNKKEAKKKFDSWQQINFAFSEGLQLQYKDIEPKIIAEEYLENDAGDLFDYKFWCFNGKVEFIMFLSERKTGLKMNNYDKDWNLLPFTYNFEQSCRKIEKPEKLSEMIALAEKLSKGFPHVRVDLYLLNDGVIKFGEMTFTSANGLCKWSDERVNYQLGKLIKLDMEYEDIEE